MKKAIFIDSQNQIIKEIAIDDDFKEIQRLVGGYFDAVKLSCGNILWVNDEGLLQDKNYFFEIEERLLAGNGVILGDDKKGNSISTKLTVPEVVSRVRFRGLGVIK